MHQPLDPSFHTPLWQSFQIQLRVIGALLMREIITRYGRHNFGFLWLFLEPMLFTLGVTGLWTLMRMGHDFALPITAFAITGYSTIMLWRNTVNKCIVAVTPNLSLMYHRNVKVMDVFFSRILLESAGATIAFVFLILVFTYGEWMEPPADLLNLTLGWLMLAWFGGALGMCVGGLSERSELTTKLWTPISYLLFPMSGAAYMVDWLSPAFREAVLWLPIVHYVELIRESYFGGSLQGHYDLAYASAITLGLTFFGLMQVHIVGKRLVPQ